MNDSQFSSRAQQIARAAVTVLGEKGASGLTHRAVDRCAGLPEGSTSNHFRTRAALIDAICRFLTDYDLASLDKASRRFSVEGDVTVGAAAEALTGIIRDWTVRESTFTAARLELFLIAHRDAEVASKMAKVRHAFRGRTTEWLDSLSKGAGQHTALVMATVEGLTANQLLHPANRMSRQKIKEELQLVLGALIA
ncbi:MAG: hypothetical protein RLO08_01335 [Parvibaculaceae bacterium]